MATTTVPCPRDGGFDAAVTRCHHSRCRPSIRGPACTHGNPIDVHRERHRARRPDLPHTRGLEAELDEARPRDGLRIGGLMIVRKVGGESTRNDSVARPCSLEDLIRRAVEVDAVYRIRTDATIRPLGRRWRIDLRAL